MKKKSKTSIYEIEEQAMLGKDVTMHFGKPRLVTSQQHVNRLNEVRLVLQLSKEMICDLETIAESLNFTSHDIAKVFLKAAIDQHHLARKAKHERSLETSTELQKFREAEKKKVQQKTSKSKR